MTTATKPKAGLEDTVATSSAICYLDGEHGVLAYCGHDIHDLAQHSTFEEVCFLLWHRRLPTRAELGDLQSQFVAARPLPEPLVRLMRSLPPGNSMDALRTLTSALGHYDADAAEQSPQANYRKAIRLTSQVASLVATMGRLNAGAGPIQPDPVLSHAANFLYMLTAERPSGRDAPAPDVTRSWPARGAGGLVRDVAANRSAGENREEAEPERRFLFGVDLPCAGDPNRSLHADLRRQPNFGMDGARARAVREQPSHPAARGVHRT